MWVYRGKTCVNICTMNVPRATMFGIQTIIWTNALIVVAQGGLSSQRAVNGFIRIFIAVRKKMTKELFRKFVEHELDNTDLVRISAESYSTIKELVSEMERMCIALQEYCNEHRYALQLGRVSLIIQGSFPGMDKQAPDGIGRVGFLFGSEGSVKENLKNIIETQETAPTRNIFQED